MNTLLDVKLEVRSLLEDDVGDWTPDAYIVPKINTTYRLQTLAIKNATGKNLENIVIVQNVPAGQTTLFPYQGSQWVDPNAQAGTKPGPGPLAGLYDPLEVNVRLAGAPPATFREAKYCGALPHVNPPGPAPSFYALDMWWTWIGNRLLVTPVNAAIDVEVWGRFNPPPLVRDSDVLVVSPDMQSVTAAGAAAVIGVGRSNPQILAGYAQMAIEGRENIEAGLIRQRQGGIARAGRVTRGPGYYGWRWA